MCYWVGYACGKLLDPAGDLSCRTCSELSHQETGEWEHLSTGSFPPWLKVALGVADQSVARAHPEAAEKTLRKRDGELQVE